MAEAERDAWVTRVLGINLSAGTASGGGKLSLVKSRQLLLRWRQAQQTLAADLDRLASAVLGNETVKRDPRFKDVEAAVKQIPNLVPKFGGKLEDLLNDGINMGADASPELVSNTLAAIADYRQQLARAPELSQLERFGADKVGVTVQLASALDSAMAEMETDLRKAA